MRKPIRLNDPTSHGGQVVATSAGHTRVLGKPLARKGDRCTCPLPGHSNCVIAEGDESWTIDGIAVALEGHKTSCGATLIATLPQFTRG
jgi:uncharacterized Zn-binding protein involved in type VI secretion